MTMKMTITTARRGFFLGFATALLIGVGCSSGGGDGTTMPVTTCTDGGPASTNAITMRCGGLTAGVTERVDVAIGGPSSGTTTLSGLSFDAVYDPSKLEFESVTSTTSDLFPPTALVIAELANGQQGRVVVSIHQVGGAPDVGVSAGQHVALSLSFRLAAGATFGPTPVQFDPARSEATDASATMSFTSALQMAHQ
jgi:hypothetical protein